MKITACNITGKFLQVLKENVRQFDTKLSRNYKTENVSNLSQEAMSSLVYNDDKNIKENKITDQ